MVGLIRQWVGRIRNGYGANPRENQVNRQYADYSFQRDDGIATISAAEQQEQIVAATVQFLDALE